MEFTTFVRRPFLVEAVEVTEDNIAEIAPLVGTLKHKDDGTPFIQVDRRLVPNVFRVWPGYWMTKMDDNIRCYAKKIFLQQFVETSPTVERYVEKMRFHLENPDASEDLSSAQTQTVVKEYGRVEEVPVEEANNAEAPSP